MRELGYIVGLMTAWWRLAWQQFWDGADEGFDRLTKENSDDTR